MHKRRQAFWIGLLAGAAVLLPICSAADGVGKNKNLETNTTAFGIDHSAEGIGADQQEAIHKATVLVQQERYDEAEKMLDDVLARFAKLMRDDKQKYVTFRSDADYRQFAAEYEAEPGGKSKLKLTRVHGSFAQALQLKAYIASSLQKWDEAIEYLDKKIFYAPYESVPYLEKGYVLNARGKPAEGLECYKKAYELGTAHNAATQEKAGALRGMGSTLIELGRLDEAEDAYNKSLEIDPGNRIALGDLAYIRKQKEKAAKGL